MQLVALTILFLMWANFLPPLATFILQDRFNTPIDCGLLWIDRQPLLGPHKTYRGVLASLIGSFFFIPILPTPSLFDLPVAALLVSLGDLITSFIKRRMKLPSGHESPVLDQTLEGLLPLSYLAIRVPLHWLQIGAALLFFIPFAFLGASLWHYMLIRPAETSRLRIVRSKARVRAWRACHQPLARWQALLNFENFIYYRVLLNFFFKVTGVYGKGIVNAQQVRLKEKSIILPSLPDTFDGFRILFLTDLHVDGVPGLGDRIIDITASLETDICLFGGDFRMGTYGPIAPTLREIKKIIPKLQAASGIFGVLGNHDCLEMIPDLEDLGMVMLVNDSFPIERGGKKIYLVGLDDAHYYKTHQPETAFQEVPRDAFSIVLCHSPEAIKEVISYNPALYLCGHTHGGQIRLPGRGPIFTHCRAPRFTSDGLWQCDRMVGYTSCGAGSSGIPLRFNCPPEVVLFTLRKMAPSS